MIEINIHGVGQHRFQHLVLDVNLTLACDGRLLDGVQTQLNRLSDQIELHLITADTQGAKGTIEGQLGLTARLIPPVDQAQAKLQLNPQTVVAIGNGANDALMLEQAALGIAVIGPEGAAQEAMRRASVVGTDIRAALDLLIYPKRQAILPGLSESSSQGACTLKPR